MWEHLSLILTSLHYLFYLFMQQILLRSSSCQLFMAGRAAGLLWTHGTRLPSEVFPPLGRTLMQNCKERAGVSGGKARRPTQLT